MSLLANQRARTAIEIVDASAQFCRAHAMPLLTIAAIVTVPTAIIGAFVAPELRVIVSLVENILFSVGGAAASVYAVTVMTEGETTFGEAFRRVSGQLGKVIAAQILFGLAILAGLFLLVLPGLIFAVRLGLGTTIAAVEGTDSSKSLSRSWALTRGHGMHVFGTVALVIGLSIVVFFGGAVLLGLLSGALGLDDATSELLLTPLMLVVAPFVWIAVTLLYIDVRVRVEGADLEAMVAELPDPTAR